MIHNKKSQVPVDLIHHLKRGHILIWDVRTPMEYIHGHIEGAENIPLDELKWHLQKDLNKAKIIITCSTGDRRSELACDQLKNIGIKVIDGGDWELLNEIVELVK